MRINPAKVGGFIVGAAILFVLVWGVGGWLRSPDGAPAGTSSTEAPDAIQTASAEGWDGVPYSSSLEEKVLTFSVLYGSPPSTQSNMYLQQLLVSEQAFIRLNRDEGITAEAIRRAKSISVRLDRTVEPDIDTSPTEGGLLVSSSVMLKYYRNNRPWVNLEANHKTVWTEVSGEWKLVAVLS